MIRLIAIILVAVGSTVTTVSANTLSPAEAGILKELNAARQNPRAYADHLRKFRREFQGGNIVRGNVRIRTQEGTKAVDEAIKFLSRQRPVPPLSVSPGLSDAANLHATEQSKTGATGHEGKNGSSPGERVNRFGKWEKTVGENIAYGFADPRDVVMQLIIDDGVPDRGHRKNIFNTKYRRIGIANAKHPKYRTVSVHVFAGDFKPKR
jgi:uncharacterized protein YkwD